MFDSSSLTYETFYKHPLPCDESFLFYVVRLMVFNDVCICYISFSYIIFHV